MPGIKHGLFRVYWLIALLAAVALYLAFVILPAAPNWGLALPAFGGVLSFVYFMQKQRLEELRLFKELFTEFNARYDKMNEDLQRIRAQGRDEPLRPEDEQRCIDYFNLCAEEYLYYHLGFIHPRVWKAWRNGMIANTRDERVNSLLERELATDSLYGLRLP